jgi:hypothetical protein
MMHFFLTKDENNGPRSAIVNDIRMKTLLAAAAAPAIVVSLSLPGLNSFHLSVWLTSSISSTLALLKSAAFSIIHAHK